MQLLLLFLLPLLRRAAGYNTFTAVSASCEPTLFKDAVIPCDPPSETSALRCANKDLVATNRTVSGVGLEVLSETGREYSYQTSNPFLYLAPFKQPFYARNYPTNATIEVVFELDDLDLPTLGYKLYDDRDSHLAFVYFSNESEYWCSTVRNFELTIRRDTGGDLYRTADFNQIFIETGVIMRTGVQYHLFWTSGSDFCIGEFPSDQIRCMQTTSDMPVLFGGTRSNTFSSARSLYKVYFAGMYGQVLDIGDMTYLHTDIPHIGTAPKFRTALANSSRVLITRLLS
jgi:hypothetical protein